MRKLGHSKRTRHPPDTVGPFSSPAKCLINKMEHFRLLFARRLARILLTCSYN